MPQRQRYDRRKPNENGAFSPDAGSTKCMPGTFFAFANLRRCGNSRASSVFSAAKTHGRYDQTSIPSSSGIHLILNERI